MDLNNFILSLLIVVFGLIFYKFVIAKMNTYYPKLLVDDQFKKPQAFHSKAISITGGIGIYFSLLIVILSLYILEDIFFVQYLSFCTLFFLLGLMDDLKLDIQPKIRLILMILFLILLVKFNNFYIYKTGIGILNDWIANSNLFSLIFVCLCFLFIINGANLIDGYNGLLGFHSTIILVNLFLINYFNENYNLTILLLYTILILLIFLTFNFPKAKVFLGDSGSYLLGVFIAFSAIQTSIANPQISPFYFCILMFYLFFEVFFSFFRKLIKEKKSPMLPDEKHLHMLLYKMLLKKNTDKIKSNYYVSIFINTAYLILIIPAIFMMENGEFCKYYSLIFFIIYIFSYKKMSNKL